ncbi:uncharacterized protein [Argopecten irradians]|uniref:uncharacterized protein n=1 Tax=Argopecten irradians TaxID=31199 RepID=UPI003713C91D
MVAMATGTAIGWNYPYMRTINSVSANERNFRWYWKNRRLGKWEEFDQENRNKLNNKYLKRKTFAHVLVDDVWHQITFQDKTMQKINTSSITVVERATRKPEFKEEGTDIDFADNDSNKISHCQGCRCRRNTSSGNKIQEINAERYKMNKIEIARTDADGSDEGDENKSLRQPTSKTKSENSSNQKRYTVGVCGTAVRDDDHFPSDGDDDDDDNNDDDDDDRKTRGDSNNKNPRQKWSTEKQRKEINAQRDSMNINEIARTDADGSDEGDENVSLKQPTSKNKGVNSSNQRRNIAGICGTAVRDGDHFPSDDENDDKDDDDDDNMKTGENKQNRRPWKRWSREKQRKGGDFHSSDFKHGTEGRKHEEYPDTKTPSTKQQDVRSTSGDEQKKYIFSGESAVHYEAYHGGIQFLSTFAESNSDVKPLHLAAQLDLKRNVSYLMEAGWDLDEEDQCGKTPVQITNPVLAEYMRCCKYPQEDMRDLQPQGGGIPGPDGVLPIDMEKVDLLDMTVYTPCFQVRKTFQRKQQKLLFASRYFTTYYNVCQQQAFGILWTLSRYGKDILHCLDDIYFTDFTIQSFHDVGTGKLDISAWILNNEREQPQEQRNQQAQADFGPSATWIQHILKQDVQNFQEELQNGIELLEDGWTPLHYAILTRQHNIVTSLLGNQFGYLETRTKTLLPQFVLEELKLCCKFEYNYVFKHMAGFTPLLLSTFIGNTDAINIIGKHVSVNRDLGDCLQLAYCEDVEKCLLDVMCSLGERHIRDKYSLNVKLHSVYEKWCPNRRILICSSNDIYRRIEEDFPPVRLVLDNNSIIRESFKPANHNMSKEDEEVLSRVINDNSDELWTRHSNLNAIVPGLSNDDKRDVMVILHCSHKGFIHTGELPFKRYLCSQGRHIRVLAIQGHFRLCPNVPENDPSSVAHPLKVCLKVGYQVTYKNYNLMATLGVMVEDDEGNTGILTCAHTFIKKDDYANLLDEKFYSTRPYAVYVHLKQPELLVSHHEDKR